MSLYVASKHAVKGYIDVLRVEIENIDKSPVAIILIQPTAANTLYPQHARNYMDQEPKLPSPTIDPTQVAAAILDAAIHPTRGKRVGNLAKVNTFVAKFFHGLADRMGANRVEDLTYDEPPRNPYGALNQPSKSTHVVARIRCTGGHENK